MFIHPNIALFQIKSKTKHQIKQRPQKKRKKQSQIKTKIAKRTLTPIETIISLTTRIKKKGNGHEIIISNTKKNLENLAAIYPKYQKSNRSNKRTSHQEYYFKIIEIFLIAKF